MRFPPNYRIRPHLTDFYAVQWEGHLFGPFDLNIEMPEPFQDEGVDPEHGILPLDGGRDSLIVEPMDVIVVSHDGSVSIMKPANFVETFECLEQTGIKVGFIVDPDEQKVPEGNLDDPS